MSILNKPNLLSLLILSGVVLIAGGYGMVTYTQGPDMEHFPVDMKYDFPFNFDQPDIVVNLPKDLKEISGLASWFEEDEVLAIQDEDGVLFIIDTKTGEVKREMAFGKDRDYEGVARNGNDIYILERDGDIHHVSYLDGVEDYKAEKLETSFSYRNDTEGMEMDPETGYLLVVPKEKELSKTDEVNHRHGIYGFNLNDSLLVSQPLFYIDEQKVGEVVYGERSRYSFKPSGIAVDPITKDIYVLASVGKILIVINRKNEIKHIELLKEKVFRQPEGLTLMQQGTYTSVAKVKAPKELSLLLGVTLSRQKEYRMSQENKTTQKDELLERAKSYVLEQFDRGLAPKYLFHNFVFSTEIKCAVSELMKGTELDEKTQLLLSLAGLFYPLGYINGHKKFRATSASELNKWAEAEGVDLSSPDGNAADWILAVKTADQDSSLPIRLLHDACWSWLGRKRFDRRSNLLQLERDAIASKEGDPIKFGEEMQKLLLNFNYLTSVGKREYDARRRKNVSIQQSENYKIEQNEVKARTGKNFGRGIDTMYRTAFRNHINLSRIADGKANMMISINTIILSIVITVSGASLSFFEDVFFENPEFLIPMISLLLSSLIAVVFAVFSARPSVTEYRIKKDKLIKSKEASLLYFGNFLKLEKKEFVEHMATMKLNQIALYDDLARDLYDLGQVMHKKYLLLTISYNTFVGGLALAVLSFLTVYLLNIL